MKKRLLITSALMTAVLGASLATGTYAWYQATGAGITASKITDNVATVNPNIQLSAVELTVSVAAKSEAPLHLASYVDTNADETPDAYKSYYLNGAGDEVEYTVSTKGGVSSKVYVVTVELDSLSAANKDTLAGQTITITVDKDTGSDSRTVVWLSETEISDNVAPGTKTSFEHTFGTSASITADLTFYVAVHVDGEKDGADTGAIDADFTVTIEKKA